MLALVRVELLLNSKIAIDYEILHAGYNMLLNIDLY